MSKITLFVTILLAFAFTPAFAGGDVAAGEEKYNAACESCHFEDDFAGEAASDIKAMILAIINGTTEHRASLEGYTEEDAANLAAYFASQTGE